MGGTCSIFVEVYVPSWASAIEQEANRPNKNLFNRITCPDQVHIPGVWQKRRGRRQCICGWCVGFLVIARPDAQPKTPAA